MSVVLQAGGALRRYGEWGELKYEYGTNADGQALGVKRFTWAEKVRARHAGLEFVLSYFSDAFVDPKRMNELAYLADQERKALEILVQMVQTAVADGVGYLGVPNPSLEVQKDAVQLLREWVRQDGYPESWEADLRRVIDQAMTRLRLWRERLQAVQARVDPAHQGWGLAFDIVPPEPREAPA